MSCALFAALALAAGSPQREQARPTAASKDCVGCHASLVSGGQQHQPLKGGHCSACHVLAPVGTAGKCQSPLGSAWALSAPQPQLCARCHDTSGAAPAHPVIKSQGCTACHDPHSSKNPALAKVWPAEALCAKCHARYDDAEFIHTAVKKGQCLGCHSPHAGEAKPLLIESRETLCSSCHKPAGLAKGLHRHAPAIEGRCLDCHDPHRSDFKAQTLEKGRKLCLGCHDASLAAGPGSPAPKYRVDLTKQVIHKPVRADDCQVCHTEQHSSDQPALLSRSVADTCSKCHPKFEEVFKFQHGAVKVGDCAVCHDPHSSANQGLLRSARASDLCFRCHQDELTGRKWVHKPAAEKGCLECHDPHGGDGPFNLVGAQGKDLCSRCHKPVDAKKNVHRAITRYGCTACHDPHAANYAKGLIRATNALCTSCHDRQQDGSHVTSIGSTHKVEGGPDPHDPARDFSCASCHDPHASDGPKLLRFGATPMESCAFCHGDKSGRHPELKDISKVKRPPAVSSREGGTP